MFDMGTFETYIINKIIEKFPFGYSEALQILNSIKSIGLLKRNITSKKEADEFLNQDINNYLMPKGFIRFKKYSETELKKLGVQLKFVKEKNDGWGTKLYVDTVNGLSWEDAPGRYSNEGYQISSDSSDTT